MPLGLHNSPCKISIIVSMPLRRGESSPVVIAGRTWPTNGTKLHRCTYELDWRRRLGRSGLRCWPAARQWPHGRRGSNSGTMRAKARLCARAGAQVGAREGPGVARGSWAHAEQEAHRRRQWWTGAATCTREGKKGGL
jgi:hypothetical protein